MPVGKWIRDFVGIWKDFVDTKKAKLEITKLEDEEDERRGLIDLATLDDVKKYDPKVGQLEQRIQQTEPAPSSRLGTFLTMVILILTLLALLLGTGLFYWVRR